MTTTTTTTTSSTPVVGTSRTHGATAQQRVPNCTSCGRNDVRRSHSRGLFDGIARTLGFKPYRCRGCRARFFAK